MPHKTTRHTALLILLPAPTPTHHHAAQDDQTHRPSHPSPCPDTNTPPMIISCWEHYAAQDDQTHRPSHPSPCPDTNTPPMIISCWEHYAAQDDQTHHPSHPSPCTDTNIPPCRTRRPDTPPFSSFSLPRHQHPTMPHKTTRHTALLILLLAPTPTPHHAAQDDQTHRPSHPSPCPDTNTPPCRTRRPDTPPFSSFSLPRHQHPTMPHKTTRHTALLILLLAPTPTPHQCLNTLSEI